MVKRLGVDCSLGRKPSLGTEVSYTKDSGSSKIEDIKQSTRTLKLWDCDSDRTFVFQ